ncbi:MAG: hypothetical protein EB127_25460 [Alphaproteobacteria bacterium]|nr:hypothetical protein [Alphaproteobacteria bacterium]
MPSQEEILQLQALVTFKDMDLNKEPSTEEVSALLTIFGNMSDSTSSINSAAIISALAQSPEIIKKYGPILSAIQKDLAADLAEASKKGDTDALIKKCQQSIENHLRDDLDITKEEPVYNKNAPHSITPDRTPPLKNKEGPSHSAVR